METEKPWHNLSVERVLKRLETGKNGLTESEAARRLKEFGLNKLPEKKRKTRLLILLNQFKSPLVYLLFAASIVSFMFRNMADGYFILAAVGLTVLFGWIQEARAEAALEKLKQLVQLKAKVMRDGEEKEILAEHLVPGDVILLNEGDKIQADIRLFESKNLEVNEANLTGESMPVSKSEEVLPAEKALPERKNMLFMATVIVRGRGKGIVVGAGLNTEIGKIAGAIQEIGEEATPLQKKLSKFSVALSLIIGILAFVIFGLGLAIGISFSEIFATAVAVAVAAIPEGLIVTVTVILVIGMRRLLKENALVRQMVAAETLGATTVICSDKTGTITEGEMKVAEIYTEGDGEEKELTLKIAMLASDARVENPQDNFTDWRLTGDPTEKALIVAALEAGLAGDYLKKEKMLLDEIPFESVNKFMAHLYDGKIGLAGAKAAMKENLIFMKGAPEKILASSERFLKDGHEKKLDPEESRRLRGVYEDFSKRGLRLLAVGYKLAEGRRTKFLEIAEPLSGLTLVGFIGLKDPIRQNVKESLELVRKAGGKVIMITGDNKLTAKTIAEELGFSVALSNILEGEELERMSDEELKRRVQDILIYARVSPSDKLRIVTALKNKGEIVAMTGDGVNDAPAIKRADIGVAVGSASEVTKEVSDMIILDNNFKTIVTAIEEGRGIFDNIKKVVLYLLSDSFSEVFLIVASLLAGFPLPILPAQILWINLVEDSLPSFALAFEPKEKEAMNEPPRKADAPLFDAEMKSVVFAVSVISVIMLLALFYWAMQIYDDISYVRTLVFAGLGINTLFYVFALKSLRKSVFHMDFFSNKYLLAAVGIGLVMLALPLYVPFLQNVLRVQPLGVAEWGVISGIGVVSVLAIEVIKWTFRKMRAETILKS